MLSLKEIIERTDSEAFKSWLLEYAKLDIQFEQALRDKFSPERMSGDKIKDYPLLIRKAFSSNYLRTGNRYREWEDYGFDAYLVSVDLKEILKDFDYFINNENLEVAVQICKNMIEIIPEEWDEQFDYDGDVQVIYDEAIEKLEVLLDTQLLSNEEKDSLFRWYKEESKNADKHEYIGLNTSFDVLQSYFLSSEDMIAQNIEMLDEKILNASEGYYRERYIVDKIEILRSAGRTEEMQKTINQNLKLSKVRKIKLELLVEDNDYSQAIKLVEDGIDIANKKDYYGEVLDWKDELLKIYQKMNDKSNILKLAKELLLCGRDQDRFYAILKQLTPEEDWQNTITEIIQKLESSTRTSGFTYFKARVLIEHEMWYELFERCKKGGVYYVEEFEKYFRPQFDSELYTIYFNYLESQVIITNQQAYENVGRILDRLKSFDGGKEKVQELVSEYRITYKRRKNMMKVLDRV